MLGPHLILDLYGCSREKLGDPDFIYRVLDELPILIGMRKLCEPHVYRVPPNPNTFDKGGVSGYVIITESHISIHTFVEQCFVSIDIFSCKEFDVDKAVEYLVNVFEADGFEKVVVKRGRKFNKVGVGGLAGSTG